MQIVAILRRFFAIQMWYIRCCACNADKPMRRFCDIFIRDIFVDPCERNDMPMDVSSCDTCNGMKLHQA